MLTYLLAVSSWDYERHQEKEMCTVQWTKVQKPVWHEICIFLKHCCFSGMLLAFLIRPPQNMSGLERILPPGFFVVVIIHGWWGTTAKKFQLSLHPIFAALAFCWTTTMVPWPSTMLWTLYTFTLLTLHLHSPCAQHLLFGISVWR